MTISNISEKPFIFMKNIIFILLCTFNALFAQNLNLDSLKKVRNYARIFMPDSMGLRMIATKEGYDLLSPDGKKANTQPYDWVGNMGQGYMRANIAGEPFLLDKEGKPLFPLIYGDYDIRVLREGLFRVRNPESYRENGIINEQNQLLLPFAHQFICKVYNANGLESARKKRDLPDKYDYFPTDSIVVFRDSQLILYDLHKGKVLELSLPEDLWEKIENRARQSSHEKHDIMEHDNMMTFVVQGNKIIMTAYFYPIEDVYVEWTIEKGMVKTNLPFILRKCENSPQHFYTFIPEEKNGAKENMLLVDENGKTVLKGKFYEPKVVDFVDDYVILEHTLVGVVDTFSQEYASKKPRENPLFQEYCNKKEGDKSNWLVSYMLYSVAEQKVILEFAARRCFYGYRLIIFWGKDKCVVEKKGELGIIDVKGKWVLPLAYREIKILNDKMVWITEKGQPFLMNQQLEKLKVSPKLSFFGLENGLICSIEDLNKTVMIKKEGYESKERCFKASVWKDFKQIYSSKISDSGRKGEEYMTEHLWAYAAFNAFHQEQTFFATTDKHFNIVGYVFISEKGEQIPLFNGTIQKCGNFYVIDMRDTNISFLFKQKNDFPLDDMYDNITFQDNYFICERADSVIYLDMEGKRLFATVWLSSLWKKNPKFVAFCKQHNYLIGDAIVMKDPEIDEFDEFYQKSFVYFQKGKPYLHTPKYLAFQRQANYGYIDSTGKEVIPLIYNKIIKISPTTFVGINASTCEKINPYTGARTKLPFEDIEPIHNCYIAKKGFSFALLNDSLELMTDFLYSEIDDDHSHYGIVRTKSTNYEKGLFNLENKKTLSAKYEKIYFSIGGGLEYELSLIFAEKPHNQGVDIYKSDLTPISIDEYEKIETYSEKCIIAKKKGKYGVIDFQNKVILPFVYSAKDSLSLFQNFHAAITTHDKKTQKLYAENGKLIWQGSVKDKIQRSNDIYAIQMSKGAESFAQILDRKGKELLAFKGFFEPQPKCNNEGFLDLDSLEKAELDADYILIHLSDSKKMNILDTKAQKRLSADCDSIFEMEKKGFVFYQNGKAGIMDTNFVVTLAPEKSPYKYIKDLMLLEDSSAIVGEVLLDTTVFYINLNGSHCFPTGYEYYKILSLEKCVVAKKGKAGCIDKKGNILIPFEWENIHEVPKSNLFIGRLDCQFYLLDSLGNKLNPNAFDALMPSYHFNGCFSVSQNKKEGILDRNGKLLIECKYDNVNSYGNDVYTVSLGDKKGLFSAEGKEILPSIYKEIPFPSYASDYNSLGSVIVKETGEKGGYNFKTKKILPAVYQEVIPFYKDYYIVKLADKMGILADNGNEILPIIYDKILKVELTQSFDAYDSITENAALVEKTGEKWYFSVRNGKPFWEKVE
jgi:hypothetical protein